jgi:hypothetical protein
MSNILKLLRLVGQPCLHKQLCKNIIKRVVATHVCAYNLLKHVKAPIHLAFCLQDLLAHASM